MSKIIGMARLSAKGGFSLFLGVTLSTIISAVGTILVVRLLPPTEYALVAIAIMPSTLITLFRDWGVNSAIVKYIAQYRSENRNKEIKELLASALLFKLALGILLSIVSFTLAGFLATNVFHLPETKNLIEIASLTILAGSFLTAAQSVFTGYERMELRSLTMICQSILKTLIAPS